MVSPTLQAQSQSRDQSPSLGNSQESNGSEASAEKDLSERHPPVSESVATEDNSCRKREREGSVEPSSQLSSTTTPQDSLPSKKNRLQTETFPEKVIEEDTAKESKEDEGVVEPATETENVKQIRKKARDLNWKEEQKDVEQGNDVESKESNHPCTASKLSADNATPTAETVKSGDDDLTKPAPAGNQPTFSSLSAKSSSFGSVPSSPKPSSASQKSGFSAFSASKGWLASGSVNPNSSFGTKPSSLGSLGNDEAHTNESDSTCLSTKPASVIKGSNLGFGAFAGASPLAKPATTPKSADSPDSQPTENQASSESFSDKLLSSKPIVGEANNDTSRPTFETTEAEVITGEEDEESIHSVRAKLYTMSEDQNWKERGTGTIRVNVPKQSDAKKTGRLVMRADGVFRVILNVSLFKGMKCELQEKFVRIIAFEEGHPVHFAIKLSNPSNAATFLDEIQQFTQDDETFV